MRVKLPGVAEGDAAAVGRLAIPVGDDGQTRLPLAALAKVHVDVGRAQINREQGGASWPSSATSPAATWARSSTRPRPVSGVFALYLTHTELSVSAVGFITLFGVAVMDGVLLILYVRHAREATPDSQQAILEAVSQRLRPVLMTALLASLGLLPAAISHAIGSDTQRPFAIVIIGGLVSSTLLTTLLLPTLYELADRWFGAGRAQRRRLARLRAP